MFLPDSTTGKERSGKMTVRKTRRSKRTGKLQIWTGKRWRKKCVTDECYKRACSTNFCSGHGGGERCQHSNCDLGAIGSTGFCSGHGGGKRCQHSDCDLGAQGSTDYCSKHGGGKRCQHLDCGIGAQGSTDYCIAHGGGKRCQHLDCDVGALIPTDFCSKHGGGKRCQQLGCDIGAQGSTDYCIGHGGGKRCQHSDCDLGAQGSTDYCTGHGGGKRCQHSDCDLGARGSTDLCSTHLNESLGLTPQKNKTQHMVRRYLENTFKVQREFRLSESGAKRFDFFLIEFNTLLEVDGPQHFGDCQFGSRWVPCSRPSDLVKQKAAQVNGMSLVRIYQPWLWNMRALPRSWKKVISDMLYKAKQNPGALVLKHQHKKVYAKHLEGWRNKIIYM